MNTNEISLQNFENLCKEVFYQRDVVDEIKSKLKEENEKLDKQKMKVLEYLEQLDKTSYPVGGLGTISIRNRFSVTMPKDENKRLFYDYLKEKGVLFAMTTINHNTLNGFYKEELNAATEAGQDDFQIPGLSEPKLTKIIAIRKGK